MSTLNEILLAVLGMAQATEPYATITIGALPADNGLSIAYATGGVDTMFLTKSACYDLDLVLNGKHEDQQIVSDALNKIHTVLTQTKDYPRTEQYQITDITSSPLPAYLSREQNSQWLYGSGLTVKACIYKGE